MAQSENREPLAKTIYNPYNLIMANPFAGFVHTSTLASLPHDPPISLASNCIRDFFGPTVQLVADALQARGGASTLGQLIGTIASKSRSKFRTDERKEIIKVSQLQSTSSVGGPSTPSIRAALLVLIQHSIVLVKKSKVTTSAKTKTIYTYEFLIDRARLLSRYPRYVEYTKKALDETAAALIEELLVQGRMRTVDAIVATVEQLHQLKDAPRSDRYTYRQAVLESFRRLVGGGFIQQVQAIKDETDETEEAEFDEHVPPPAKKARIEEHSTDDPAVVSLLQSGPYKILPREAVWRVNLEMFHDSLRAVSLGWLVAERYGHKVQSSGSMVTAALKLAAHKRHAQQDADFETQSNFSTESITRYLPKSVLQNLEKKPGGVFPNLHKALVELTKFTNPSVVDEMEVADGHPENAQFQIATRKLIQYLHDRIIHQVILDSHGEVAARICSILRHTGYLESDAIAESAMVPAKDTREVLHRLYRENIISLFNLNQGKQHNPANMIYMWAVDKKKILRNITDNVFTAFLNMRLRRQHEVEVGKDWIVRAKEAGATDENENETDKVNYTRFCQGLERLDNAILQLDETMMVLKDF